MFYGVKTEILALSEIPYIKGSRARLLYRAGLRTPEDVAQASVDRIFEILTEGVEKLSLNFFTLRLVEQHNMVVQPCGLVKLLVLQDAGR
jgi:replicative superfamily II helicase